ncbi:MAG: phosphate starvation-inducible protein PhoH [Alphaproteobacteria bacterium]|nr:phosphate starvation-inducible protein PhoH [Alphaproteobacteria bacterium]
MLYGEHDSNLARIEHQLGVSLASRGNTVTIIGVADAAEAARTALAALWERVRKGLVLGAPDIDAAVRLSRDSGAEPDADLAQLTRPENTIVTRKRAIAPRTPGQARYIETLRAYPLVLAIGPAGTGKTYLAVAQAVSMLARGQVDRIILSRPAVEAGERLGFLPGDMREKVDPYLRPLYDALYDMLPGEQVARHIESGMIEIAPLAFMRGRTLANAYVILDEAQNTTTMQMRMFLTRMGENSRMVVTGDISQVDLPAGQRSGLVDALEVLDNIQEVGTVTFSHLDVVRHALVTRIVRAYEAQDKRRGQGT